MSEIDPGADIPLVDWRDLGVSGLLPTGTLTLLLADVDCSTRLWETQPELMTAAFARLDHELWDLVATHGGVRPVERGEGDSFVVAFARASGVPRPERVVQLCHPDLRNDFPPLRTPKSVATQSVPLQFTSFDGRGPQMTEVRKHQTRPHLARAARQGSSPPRLIVLRQQLGSKRFSLKTGEYSPDNLPRNTRFPPPSSPVGTAFNCSALRRCRANPSDLQPSRDTDLKRRKNACVKLLGHQSSSTYSGRAVKLGGRDWRRVG
jgi:hypothetical protein